MASGHHDGSARLGATFFPGGSDDFSMPELVSPSPQRSAPEEYNELQGNLERMEIGAKTYRPESAQSQMQSELYGPGPRGGTPAVISPAMSQGSFPNSRQSSVNTGHNVPTDEPSFSPFPRLDPRPPNVPPSDDEKLMILDTARQRVIASNDPEIQLIWAQDTLNFVEIAALNESRNAVDGPRPATPRAEHELKQEAINITSFLAEQSHPRAQFIKGMWLEFGKFGTRKDLRESYRCYARAAERGYSRAEYRMGMQFENSGDIQKAIQHYNVGVRDNDAASAYRMGMMILLGQHGQVQDVQYGLELVKFAGDNADENAPQGAYIYGMLCAREMPEINIPEYALPMDQNMARTYIEKAAFLGFAKAQTKLGKAYEHGQLGCQFDATTSLHYNNLAARQGDEDAEMAISKWFLSGQEGVFQKNEQLAFLYANRAAKSGRTPTAEFAMGYFHEVGIACTVDLKEAQRWYRKAAEHGNKDAAARIDGIGRSKTLSRKDHERVAMTRLNNTRGSVHGSRPPRTSSRTPMASPAVAMPQPTMPPNGGYFPQGQAQGLGYPPSGPGHLQMPAAGPSYGTYGPAQHPPGPGHPGNSIPASPRLPSGSGYGSPAPGRPQGLSPRIPYTANQPPRTSSAQSAPQTAPARRPVPGQQPKSQTPQPDFGFQAPPDYSRPRPDYTAGGVRPDYAPTTRPDHPSNPGTPVGGRPAPSPSSGPQSRPASRPNPNLSRPPPQQAQSQPPMPPAPAAARPAPTSTNSQASSRPAPQGPSTFEEMGVPKVKDKDECIVM